MGSVRARKDNGLLFFDFRYEGERCREQTLLTDTPPNRKRMEKALLKIETEINVEMHAHSGTPQPRHPKRR